MRLTLPNILTLVRVAMIPLLAVVFYLPVDWAGPVAAAIFAIAGLTDWLDGYLARRLGQESPFGAFLDPVADKLMVAVALVLILESHPSISVALATAVIISREITISALREWMAEIGQRAVVKVSMVGKVKTTAQIVALILLLYGQPLAGVPVYQVGLVLLWVAAGLTLYSMVLYLRAAFRAIGESP